MFRNMCQAREYNSLPSVLVWKLSAFQIPGNDLFSSPEHTLWYILAKRLSSQNQQFCGKAWHPLPPLQYVFNTVTKKRKNPFEIQNPGEILEVGGEHFTSFDPEQEPLRGQVQIVFL